MKIDAHQHFWFYNPTEYAWIGDNMQVLKRDFLPENLKNELRYAGFDGSIAVQARQTFDETLWLLGLAEKYDFIKGVVGWVDLCSDNLSSQLDEASQSKKFAGVRHVIHDENDDRFMAREDFRRGIRLLEKYGLTYDLLLFPKHLQLAAELVSKFPNQKFVLDHMGKPLIKNQIFSPWDKDIKKLAEFPNVYCKLSGMVTETDWKKWNMSDFMNYLDIVFDCFGKDRLMIGSDWPVCTVAGGYDEVMSIVTTYLQKMDEETRFKILGENCRRFYLEE